MKYIEISIAKFHKISQSFRTPKNGFLSRDIELYWPFIWGAYHLLATNAVAEKKSVAGCPIIHNKSRPMDAQPILSTQKWKRKKFEFKKLKMIEEDVPIDEVNSGEGYLELFHADKTQWRSKVRFTCLRILIVNLIEISINFDWSFIDETSMKHYWSFMIVKIAMKLHVKFHWNFS